MLRFGTITEIDAAKCYARVAFLDEPEIVSDFLQICVPGAVGNQYTRIFDINEQVACLMDENSEQGVILGALWNNKNVANGDKDITRVKFSDNSFIEYNRATHECNVNVQGKVNITALTEVKITAPIITVAGNLAVSGSVSAGGGGLSIDESGNATITGDLTATGDIKSGTVTLSSHTHTGVQTGGGTSGPPTP